MTTPFTDLADALEAGDDARIASLVADVTTAIETTQRRTLALQPLAVATRRQAPADSDVSTACTTLLGEGAVAAESHSELGLKLAGYYADEVSAADAADTARAAANAHAAFEDAANTVRAADVDVGPILGVFGPGDVELPAGAPANVEYTVENLGTAATTELATSITTRASVTTTPDTVAALDAGDTATVTLAGTPDEGGRYTASLRVTGDQAATDRDVQIVVKTKLDFVEDAIAAIDGMLGLLEDAAAAPNDGNGKGRGNGKGSDNGTSKDRGGGAGGVNGLRAKLKASRKRLVKVRDALEADAATGGVNGKLQSVERTLGAFLNQVDALEGTSLSAALAVRLEASATDVIDTLTAARRAQP